MLCSQESMWEGAQVRNGRQMPAGKHWGCVVLGLGIEKSHFVLRVCTYVPTIECQCLYILVIYGKSSLHTDFQGELEPALVSRMEVDPALESACVCAELLGASSAGSWEPWPGLLFLPLSYAVGTLLSRIPESFMHH